MIPGRTYRHVNTLDIDLNISMVKPILGGLEITATIFNRHNQIIYEVASTYIIKTEDIPNWRLVS